MLRLFYLSVTGVFGLLRLLPVSDRDKDAEILVLRHQIAVLQRQLGTTRPRFSPGGRAFLAALLNRLPRGLLGRIRLLVRPDTVLRWHRDHRDRGLRHQIPITSQSSGLSKLPSFTRPEDTRAVAYQRLDHRLGAITPGELAAVRRVLRAFLDL